MKVWGIEAGFPHSEPDKFICPALRENSLGVAKIRRDILFLDSWEAWQSLSEVPVLFRALLWTPQKLTGEWWHQASCPSSPLTLWSSLMRRAGTWTSSHRAEELKPADHACWETLRERSNHKRSPKRWHFTALATEWLSGMGGLLS